MKKIIIFYIFFLNLISINPTISKLKYGYYLLMSIACFFIILKNINNIKLNVKNEFIIKFIGFMLITIPSTIQLALNTQSMDLMSSYIRVWMFIPILIYLYLVKIDNLPQELIKYSIFINSFSMLDLIINLDRFGRIQGVFSHPNFYAFYILIVIISLLYCIANKKIKKKSGIAYILINILMLLAAGSKTAFIILLIVLLYQYKEYFKNLNVLLKIPMIIGTVIAILITVFMFNNSLSELRVFNLDYGLQYVNQVNSFEWRIIKWKETFTHWGSSIFGIFMGYGSGSEVLYGIKDFAMHNEYLRILFNYGIIGFLACSNFILGVFNKVRRIRQINTKKFYYSILIVIFIGCLSENVFVAVETNVLLLSLIFSINSMNR